MLRLVVRRTRALATPPRRRLRGASLSVLLAALVPALAVAPAAGAGPAATVPAATEALGSIRVGRQVEIVDGGPYIGLRACGEMFRTAYAAVVFDATGPFHGSIVLWSRSDLEGRYEIEWMSDEGGGLLCITLRQEGVPEAARE